MSGTELGRLMSEVTEQPPVDVDFAAVAHKVRRHRARVRGTAVAGCVVAVAVIVAVPFAVGGERADKAARPSPTATPATPTPTAVHPNAWIAQAATASSIGSSLRHGSSSTPVLGNHGRLFNSNIQGPYLSTEPARRGCSPTSDGFECNPIQVLKRLPNDGVCRGADRQLRRRPAARHR